MTWDDFKQQDLERDAKSSARDLDAAAAAPILPHSPAIKPGFWRRVMSTMTGKQRRDEYLRKKERERSRALTIVPPRAVAPQAAREAVSDATSLAAQSPSAVHRFVNRDSVLGKYREFPEMAPGAAAESKRNWFFDWLTSRNSLFGGGICGAIGVGFATYGLVVNAYSYGKLGKTPTEMLLSSSGGILIDAAAIVGLSTACWLGRAKQRFMAAVAVAAWAFFTSLSLIPTASFNARLLDDDTAGRASAIQQATEARTQRTTAIAIAKDAVKLAKTRAEKQKANAELAQANAAPITTTAVATADPGAKMLADMLAWFGVSESLVRRIQVGGLTVAPAFAGLFLCFATILFGRRR
jgi:hypothetical protein